MKPSPARQTLCVAQREYLATVRTKGFLIGLFVIPVLMFGAILVIPLFQGYRDTADRQIAVIDHTQRLQSAITNAAIDRNQNHIHHPSSGKKQAPAYLIEIIPPNPTNPELQQLSLSDRVRSKNLHAFVEIGPDLIHPGTNSQTSAMNYHSPGAALDEARGWLADVINQQIRRLRLADAGLNEQQMPELFRSEPLEAMSLLSTNSTTGTIQQAERHDRLQAVIGPAVLALIMYLMILMAALPMLNAVMEEKTQRIAEVLLGSTPPFALMAGKILSALAVALTGTTIYVALGISSGTYLAALQYIPWSILPWFLLYLCPAIIMFAALSTALGAACNDPKDAQNLTFPVILPAMLPMFFLGPVLRDPASPLSTILSLFPPFTPVLMLIRLGHPAGAPIWQGALGLVGILLAAAFSVWIASRIFRVAILTQGATPRLRDILRWTLKG